MGSLTLTAETDLAGYRRVDLAPFQEEMTPVARRKLMAEKFPSTQGVDWEKAFDNDMGLLGHLLRDILRLEMADPRQSGRRPSLEEKTATPALDRMLGKNYCDRPYSLLAFGPTLVLLAGNRSVQSLATKLDLSKGQVHRYLQGVDTPTLQTMEHIARIFEKSPSFFFEYRVLTLATAFREHLDRAPETTIRLYEKLWQSMP